MPKDPLYTADARAPGDEAPVAEQAQAEDDALQEGVAPTQDESVEATDGPESAVDRPSDSSPTADTDGTPER